LSIFTEVARPLVSYGRGAMPPDPGGTTLERNDMKLALSLETLAELTADDMAAVVGGAEESNSCSIASCVTNNLLIARVPAIDIC
jgi:hypothetical protein